MPLDVIKRDVYTNIRFIKVECVVSPCQFSSKPLRLNSVDDKTFQGTNLATTEQHPKDTVATTQQHPSIRLYLLNIVEHTSPLKMMVISEEKMIYKTLNVWKDFVGQKNQKNTALV